MDELVYQKKGEALTDSLTVAEKFHRKHNSVLRAIDNQRKNALVEDRKLYRETTYVDAKGESRRMYLINRQGYEILVMGFTGDDAIEWKLKYSDAFTAMETLLREKSSPEWLESRKAGKLSRKTETDTLKELVNYAKSQGSTRADKLYIPYSTLVKKMAGVEDREKATVRQLSLVQMMEDIIQKVIAAGMAAGVPYKEIYQQCKERLLTLKSVAYLG